MHGNMIVVSCNYDMGATEDIFKRRIDKYNEKKGYRWEIQNIILTKEPLPRKADGSVNEEAVYELIEKYGK